MVAMFHRRCDVELCCFLLLTTSDILSSHDGPRHGTAQPGSGREALPSRKVDSFHLRAFATMEFSCNISNSCVSAWVVEPECWKGFLHTTGRGYIKISLHALHCQTNDMNNSTFEIYWLWSSGADYLKEINRCRHLSMCRVPAHTIGYSSTAKQWLNILLYLDEGSYAGIIKVASDPKLSHDESFLKTAAGAIDEDVVQQTGDLLHRSGRPVFMRISKVENTGGEIKKIGSFDVGRSHAGTDRRKRAINEAQDLAVLMQAERPDARRKISEMIATDFASGGFRDPFVRRTRRLSPFRYNANALKNLMYGRSQFGKGVSGKISPILIKLRMRIKQKERELGEAVHDLKVANVRHSAAAASGGDIASTMLAKTRAKGRIEYLRDTLRNLRTTYDRVYTGSKAGTTKKLHGLIAISAIWGEWAQWSKCSVDCGEGGFSVRRRDCETLPDVPCTGTNFDMRSCGAGFSCDAKFHDWGNWGPCSVSCGKGVRARSRVCVTADKRKRCRGPSTVLEKCIFPKCGPRRPRAPVRVPYSAPVVPPPPPPPVAYGVNPGAAAGLGAYPVAQGYYRQPVPGAFYPPAYYRSPYSYPYPYPYAMVAGGAAGVGGLGMRHPPVVRSPKIQGRPGSLSRATIVETGRGGPRVYTQTVAPVPKVAKIKEKKQEKERKLTPEVILMIVLTFICLLLLIIAFAVYFYQKYKEHKTLSELAAARPFYKQGTVGDDDEDDLGGGPVHGVIKPVVKATDLPDAPSPKPRDQFVITAEVSAPKDLAEPEAHYEQVTPESTNIESADDSEDSGKKKKGKKKKQKDKAGTEAEQGERTEDSGPDDKGQSSRTEMEKKKGEDSVSEGTEEKKEAAVVGGGDQQAAVSNKMNEAKQGPAGDKTAETKQGPAGDKTAETKQGPAGDKTAETKQEPAVDKTAEAKQEPAADKTAEAKQEPAEAKQEPAGDKTAETKQKPAGDKTAKTKQKPAGDKTAKTKQKPAGDKTAEAKQEPAGDKTAEAKQEPAGDKTAEAKQEPAGDKTAEAKQEPAGDKTAEAKQEPAGDKTAETKQEPAGDASDESKNKTGKDKTASHVDSTDREMHDFANKTVTQMESHSLLSSLRHESRLIHTSEQKGFPETEGQILHTLHPAQLQTPTLRAELNEGPHYSYQPSKLQYSRSKHQTHSDQFIQKCRTSTDGSERFLVSSFGKFDQKSIKYAEGGPESSSSLLKSHNERSFIRGKTHQRLKNKVNPYFKSHSKSPRYKYMPERSENMLQYYRKPNRYRFRLVACKNKVRVGVHSGKSSKDLFSAYTTSESDVYPEDDSTFDATNSFHLHKTSSLKMAGIGTEIDDGFWRETLTGQCHEIKNKETLKSELENLSYLTRTDGEQTKKMSSYEQTSGSSTQREHPFCENLVKMSTVSQPSEAQLQKRSSTMSPSSSSWLSSLLSESDRKLNEIDKDIDAVLKEQCHLHVGNNAPLPPKTEAGKVPYPCRKNLKSERVSVKFPAKKDNFGPKVHEKRKNREAEGAFVALESGLSSSKANIWKKVRPVCPETAVRADMQYKHKECDSVNVSSQTKKLATSSENQSWESYEKKKEDVLKLLQSTSLYQSSGQTTYYSDPWKPLLPQKMVDSNQMPEGHNFLSSREPGKATMDKSPVSNCQNIPTPQQSSQTASTTWAYQDVMTDFDITSEGSHTLTSLVYTEKFISSAKAKTYKALVPVPATCSNVLDEMWQTEKNKILKFPVVSTSSSVRNTADSCASSNDKSGRAQQVVSEDAEKTSRLFNKRHTQELKQNATFGDGLHANTLEQKHIKSALLVTHASNSSDLRGKHIEGSTDKQVTTEPEDPSQKTTKEEEEESKTRNIWPLLCDRDMDKNDRSCDSRQQQDVLKQRGTYKNTRVSQSTGSDLKICLIQEAVPGFNQSHSLRRGDTSSVKHKLQVNTDKADHKEAPSKMQDTLSDFAPTSSEISSHEHSQYLCSNEVSVQDVEKYDKILDRQLEIFMDSTSWISAKDTSKIHIDWDINKDNKRKQFEMFHRSKTSSDTDMLVSAATHSHITSVESSDGGKTTTTNDTLCKLNVGHEISSDKRMKYQTNRSTEYAADLLHRHVENSQESSHNAYHSFPAFSQSTEISDQIVSTSAEELTVTEETGKHSISSHNISVNEHHHLVLASSTHFGQQTEDREICKTETSDSLASDNCNFSTPQSQESWRTAKTNESVYRSPCKSDYSLYETDIVNSSRVPSSLSRAFSLVSANSTNHNAVSGYVENISTKISESQFLDTVYLMPMCSDIVDETFIPYVSIFKDTTSDYDNFSSISTVESEDLVNVLNSSSKNVGPPEHIGSSLHAVNKVRQESGSCGSCCLEETVKGTSYFDASENHNADKLQNNDICILPSYEGDIKHAMISVSVVPSSTSWSDVSKNLECGQKRENDSQKTQQEKLSSRHKTLNVKTTSLSLGNSELDKAVSFLDPYITSRSFDVGSPSDIHHPQICTVSVSSDEDECSVLKGETETAHSIPITKLNTTYNKSSPELKSLPAVTNITYTLPYSFFMAEQDKESPKVDGLFSESLSEQQAGCEPRSDIQVRNFSTEVSGYYKQAIYESFCTGSDEGVLNSFDVPRTESYATSVISEDKKYEGDLLHVRPYHLLSEVGDDESFTSESRRSHVNVFTHSQSKKSGNLSIARKSANVFHMHDVHGKEHGCYLQHSEGSHDNKQENSESFTAVVDLTTSFYRRAIQWSPVLDTVSHSDILKQQQPSSHTTAAVISSGHTETATEVSEHAFSQGMMTLCSDPTTKAFSVSCKNKNSIDVSAQIFQSEVSSAGLGDVSRRVTVESMEKTAQTTHTYSKFFVKNKENLSCEQTRTENGYEVLDKPGLTSCVPKNVSSETQDITYSTVLDASCGISLNLEDTRLTEAANKSHQPLPAELRSSQYEKKSPVVQVISDGDFIQIISSVQKRGEECKSFEKGNSSMKRECYDYSPVVHFQKNEHSSSDYSSVRLDLTTADIAVDSSAGSLGSLNVQLNSSHNVAALDVQAAGRYSKQVSCSDNLSSLSPHAPLSTCDGYRQGRSECTSTSSARDQYTEFMNCRESVWSSTNVGNFTSTPFVESGQEQGATTDFLVDGHITKGRVPTVKQSISGHIQSEHDQLHSTKKVLAALCDSDPSNVSCIGSDSKSDFLCKKQDPDLYSLWHEIKSSSERNDFNSPSSADLKCVSHEKKQGKAIAFVSAVESEFQHLSFNEFSVASDRSNDLSWTSGVTESVSDIYNSETCSRDAYARHTSSISLVIPKRIEKEHNQIIPSDSIQMSTYMVSAVGSCCPLSCSRESDGGLNQSFNREEPELIFYNFRCSHEVDGDVAKSDLLKKDSDTTAACTVQAVQLDSPEKEDTKYTRSLSRRDVEGQDLSLLSSHRTCYKSQGASESVVRSSDVFMSSPQRTLGENSFVHDKAFDDGRLPAVDYFRSLALGDVRSPAVDYFRSPEVGDVMSPVVSDFRLPVVSDVMSPAVSDVMSPAISDVMSPAVDVSEFQPLKKLKRNMTQQRKCQSLSQMKMTSVDKSTVTVNKAAEETEKKTSARSNANWVLERGLQADEKNVSHHHSIEQSPEAKLGLNRRHDLLTSSSKQCSLHRQDKECSHVTCVQECKQKSATQLTCPSSNVCTVLNEQRHADSREKPHKQPQKGYQRASLFKIKDSATCKSDTTFTSNLRGDGEFPVTCVVHKGEKSLSDSVEDNEHSNFESLVARWSPLESKSSMTEYCCYDSEHLSVSPSLSCCSSSCSCCQQTDQSSSDGSYIIHGGIHPGTSCIVTSGLPCMLNFSPVQRILKSGHSTSLMTCPCDITQYGSSNETCKLSVQVKESTMSLQDPEHRKPRASSRSLLRKASAEHKKSVHSSSCIADMSTGKTMQLSSRLSVAERDPLPIKGAKDETSSFNRSSKVVDKNKFVPSTIDTTCNIKADSISCSSSKIQSSDHAESTNDASFSPFTHLDRRSSHSSSCKLIRSSVVHRHHHHSSFSALGSGSDLSSRSSRTESLRDQGMYISSTHDESTSFSSVQGWKSSQVSSARKSDLKQESLCKMDDSCTLSESNSASKRQHCQDLSIISSYSDIKGTSSSTSKFQDQSQIDCLKDTTTQFDDVVSQKSSDIFFMTKHSDLDFETPIETLGSGERHMLLYGSAIDTDPVYSLSSESESCYSSCVKDSSIQFSDVQPWKSSETLSTRSYLDLTEDLCWRGASYNLTESKSDTPRKNHGHKEVARKTDVSQNRVVGRKCYHCRSKSFSKKDTK